MFKRTGSPAKVEALKFEVKGAQNILCPKCGAIVGIKSSANMVKIAGQNPVIATNGFKAKCPQCGECFDV